mgnify:CR=1 FL=1
MAGNDHINGRGGNDRLEGGLGADVLTGAAGADRFVFASKLGAGNVDVITDFVVGRDTIVLDHVLFARLTAGDLGADAFATGSRAEDGSDRIIYNSRTGALSYDADGVGGDKAIQFAELDAGLKLSESDFHIA